MDVETERHDRHINVKDCAMLFGIPTSAEAFRDAVNCGKRREFVSWQRSLLQYEEIFLNDLKTALPVIVDAGVRVVEDGTLEDVGRLCQGRFRVVTILSHASEDEIELSDGMATWEQLSARIPLSYVGILDICACCVTGAVHKLRQNGQRFLVQCSEGKLYPGFFTLFYAALYRTMAREHVSYVDALVRVQQAFLQKVGVTDWKVTSW